MFSDAQKNFLVGIIDAIPSPAFFSDTQGILLWCNSSFAVFSECGMLDLIGKNIYGFFPDLPVFIPDEHTARSETQPDCIKEITLRKSSGSIVYIIYNVRHCSFSQEGPRGFLGTIQNITHLKERELQLSNLHNRYFNLFQGSIDAIVFCSLNGSIRSVNTAFIRMTGYTEAEFTDKPYNILIPSDYRAIYSEQLVKQSVIKGSSPLTRLQLMHKNGTVLTVECRSWISYAEDEYPSGIWISHRDISQTVLFEAKNYELTKINETLIKNSPSGILLYDKNGNCIYANDRAVAIIGAEKKENLLLQNFLHVASWKKSGLADMAARTMESSTTEEIFIKIQSTFKKNLWILCVFNGIQYNNEKSLILQIQDLTEVHDKQNKLENKIQELDEFVRIASHDLREPLNSVRNFCHFLKEDFAHALPPEGIELIDTINTLSQQATANIEELAKYSRLGKLAGFSAQVNVTSLVDGILESIILFIQENHADITITRPLPQVKGNKVLLREIFYNLIINGIKFNDSKTKQICVSWKAAAEYSGTVYKNVFYVQDNGIGIDPSNYHNVFSIFRRLHGRKKYGGGSGTGLAIVKKCVELHNGTIWIDSQPGEGTTFYFTLSPAE